MNPISPQEALDQKISVIPGQMIEAVNILLRKHYNGTSAIIKQGELMCLFLKLYSNEGLNPATVYANKWMNIENVYAKFGWSVSYDKPGYSEDYEAYFTFRPIKL